MSPTTQLSSELDALLVLQSITSEHGKQTGKEAQTNTVDTPQGPSVPQPQLQQESLEENRKQQEGDATGNSPGNKEHVIEDNSDNGINDTPFIDNTNTGQNQSNEAPGVSQQLSTITEETESEANLGARKKTKRGSSKEARDARASFPFSTEKPISPRAYQQSLNLRNTENKV